MQVDNSDPRGTVELQRAVDHQLVEILRPMTSSNDEWPLV